MTRAHLALPLFAAFGIAACSSSPDAGGPDRNGESDVVVDDISRPGDDAAIESDAVSPDDATSADVAADDTVEADGSAPIEEPTITRVIVADGAVALPDLFAAATTTTGGPAVVYPVDETAMPINVGAPLFQWEGPNASAYRLRIVGENVGVDVFTTEWSWQPTTDEWDDIRLDAAGTELTLTVTQLTGATAVVGAPSRLEISTASVDGAIYFWAPSQSAIVRLPIASDEPEPFVTGTVFNCAGCHALSPDGSRLAYTRSAGGTPIGSMGVISTDSSRTQIQPERLNGYYPSFAPDNIHLAAARDGGIVIINTDTGDDVTDLPQPDNTSASQPTWSPRDEAIVYAAGPGTPGGDLMGALGVSASGLVRVPRRGDGWGVPEWLVESGDAESPGETLFYPAYSPSGEFIVFNRANTSAGVGASPAESSLWVVNSSPFAEVPPVRLDRANGPAGTTNSWPKWAPHTSDGRMWVAFTSTRAYGRVPVGGSQIWIASVHAQDALLGIDPSSAAYWMPNQELGTSNHVAYWAPYRKDEETE